MNWLDRGIAALFPGWAVSRYKRRAELASYEGDKPTRLRKRNIETRGPDAVMKSSGHGLRGHARFLDENHDLVTGILDTLVVRCVGPSGIMYEPMVRDKNGKLHKQFNRELLEGFNEWYERPDVTGELSGPECEQLAARTWLRDGEMFTQFVLGDKPGLKHPTNAKFLVELLEPDFIPWDYDDEGKGITQGVQKNAWGRPTAYFAYKKHPGEELFYSITEKDLKRVPAEIINHLKLTKRIRQTRGVSVLHAVITRLENLKDYEESEQVAARVAAAMAGFIKKGNPDSYIPPTDADQGDRSFTLRPGMIFDKLRPGEEVGTVQSNRPSALMEPFRNAMIKMISAGSKVSYSSASKDYNGTYSAQRQGLVEQYEVYTTLQNYFADHWKRPLVKQYIQMSILTGRLVLPDDVDENTLFRGHYQGPAMPWIDPDKESKANERDCQAGFQSRSAVIRKRNQNPVLVEEQIEMERSLAKEKKLVYSTDLASTQSQAEESQPDIEEDQQEEEAA